MSGVAGFIFLTYFLFTGSTSLIAVVTAVLVTAVAVLVVVVVIIIYLQNFFNQNWSSS